MTSISPPSSAETAAAQSSSLSAANPSDPSDRAEEKWGAAVDPVFPPDFSFTGMDGDTFAQDPSTGSQWQGLVTYLNSLGNKELNRRWQKARQIMHEHGVAYDIFSEEAGTKRPWELDPIPFAVPARTREFLDKGIRQRARLLSAVFADIYGPQKLIRNNHLPPELFFANPRFLHQCHGLYQNAISELHFYATDLGRFPDGEWRVFSDHTQAPAGAGYALENRIILSRILPRMFHSGKVHRLAPFFKSLHHSLMKISGIQKREPTIVMLSPGPSSTTYFEHVFLSRYLGLTLVESSDLTVRNDAVFLKTLGGLHPVDVIWRRIEDTFCDPLAFGSNSLVGVSGLVQAVRAGNVVVANPLGTGVLANPGLIPFLPGLCRLILDEELVLQDIPTAWCGQEGPLTSVLARMDDPADPVIIASAFAHPQMPAVVVRELSVEKKEALKAKIKTAPHAYVARSPMAPSTLPVWDEGGVANRFAAVRMFSAATVSKRRAVEPANAVGGGIVTGTAEVTVMPGGLTRISDQENAFLRNAATELGSKDTWCFSEGVVEYKSMMHHFSEGFEIHRGGDLSSRVADNMLWMGRYMERTEGMLRVIRSVLSRLNSETPLNMIDEFPFLLRIMSSLDICSDTLSQPGAVYNMRIIETEVMTSIFSAGRSGSLRKSLENVRRVATSVRDRLSNDSWHILSRMENELVRFSPHRHNQISEAQELVNEMILSMSAFAGLALESMTRSMGWRFMDMGRRLERAGYMISLLQRLFSEDGVPAGSSLEALLEVADSIITYHTRYRTTLVTAPIVDLLLLDELNPRAVGFQLAALSDHVATLPGNIPQAFRTPEEKIMLDLTTQLRLTDIHSLMEMTPEGTLPRLHSLLEKLDGGLQRLSTRITQHYLSRVETEKQLRNAFQKKSDKPFFSGGGEKHFEI